MMALRSRGDGFNLGDDFPPGLQQLHHLRFVMMEAWQGSFLFEVLSHGSKKVKHVIIWVKSRSLTFLKYSLRFFFSDSSSAAAC